MAQITSIAFITTGQISQGFLQNIEICWRSYKYKKDRCNKKYKVLEKDL